MKKKMSFDLVQEYLEPYQTFHNKTIILRTKLITPYESPKQLDAFKLVKHQPLWVRKKTNES